MTADLAEEQTAAQLATERLETEQVTIESWAVGTRHNLCDNMKNRCTTAKYCVETSFWLRGANTFHIFACHRSVVA